MDPAALVTAICDQADGFLAGVTKPEEARAGIAEWLTIHQPGLAPPEKKAVIAQAMRILDQEGFFEAEAGGEA